MAEPTHDTEGPRYPHLDEVPGWSISHLPLRSVINATPIPSRVASLTPPSDGWWRGWGHTDPNRWVAPRYTEVTCRLRTALRLVHEAAYVLATGNLPEW